MTSPFTAYVSCQDGAAIEVFYGDAETATLEHVQTVALQGRGMPVTLTPDGRFLFAGSFEPAEGGETAKLESFAVHPDTRRLSPLSVIPAVGRMAHIAVDRTGSFLLGASFQKSRIAVHAIGAQGHLQPVPIAAMDCPLRSHQTLPDPSNRFLYVPCMLSDTVLCLTFDAQTGDLGANEPPAIRLPEGQGPRHVAFHPGRRFLYLMCELGGTVVAYRIDPHTGALCEVMTASYLPEDFTGKPWGAQVVVSPDGRLLVTGDRGSETLALWDIDPESGRIDNRRLVGCGRNPRCHAMTNNGRLLIVAAMDDNKIEVFTMTGPEGVPVKTCELPTSAAPGWVEIAR